MPAIEVLHPYVQKLRAAYEPHRHAQNATQMFLYLKEKFPFFGIKAPERRAILQAFLKENPLPEIGEFPIILRDLWQQPERELHHTAMELCEKYKKQWSENILDELEYMIANKGWWDTVDFVAIHLVGAYFQKFPHKTMEVTEKWIASNDLWLQRTCIIFQIKYKGKTNESLLTDYILLMKDSKEFFLRKAIGWALREYAKRSPQFVLAFVNQVSLSSLSRKEALKHFHQE